MTSDFYFASKNVWHSSLWCLQSEDWSLQFTSCSKISSRRTWCAQQHKLLWALSVCCGLGRDVAQAWGQHDQCLGSSMPIPTCADPTSQTHCHHTPSRTLMLHVATSLKIKNKMTPMPLYRGYAHAQILPWSTIPGNNYGTTLRGCSWRSFNISQTTLTFFKAQTFCHQETKWIYETAVVRQLHFLHEVEENNLESLKPEGKLMESWGKHHSIAPP